MFAVCTMQVLNTGEAGYICSHVTAASTSHLHEILSLDKHPRSASEHTNLEDVKLFVKWARAQVCRGVPSQYFNLTGCHRCSRIAELTADNFVPIWTRVTLFPHPESKIYHHYYIVVIIIPLSDSIQNMAMDEAHLTVLDDVVSILGHQVLSFGRVVGAVVTQILGLCLRAKGRFIDSIFTGRYHSDVSASVVDCTKVKQLLKREPSLRALDVIKNFINGKWQCTDTLVCNNG